MHNLAADSGAGAAWVLQQARNLSFTGVFDRVDTRTVVEWFDLGGSLQLSDNSSAEEVIAQTRGVGGLRELTERAGLPPGAPAPLVASAIDFVLEGLCALKKISRTNDGKLHAPPATGARKRDPQRDIQQMMEEDEGEAGKGKKKYYN